MYTYNICVCVMNIFILQVGIRWLVTNSIIIPFLSQNIPALSEQPNKGNYMQCKTADTNFAKLYEKMIGPTGNRQWIMHQTNTHLMACTLTNSHGLQPNNSKRSLRSSERRFILILNPLQQLSNSPFPLIHFAYGWMLEYFPRSFYYT